MGHIELARAGHAHLVLQVHAFAHRPHARYVEPQLERVIYYGTTFVIDPGKTPLSAASF
jgi:hypothetical protein